MTASALSQKQFAPVSYVVPRLIVEGVTVKAGRPKIGKSWMALDIGIGVAAGTPVLGGLQPQTGDVLYLAAEDNDRRLQSRISKLIGPATQWPDRLALATSWARLDDGGVNDIASWADSVKEPRLAILDTLAAFRPQKPARDTQYQIDYTSIAELQRMALDKRLAVLVLAHDRKQAADDPFDAVSGTLGLTGCADTVAVIARSGRGTTLYIRGRDIEEQELGVSFDRATCRWSILGNAEDVHRSQTRRTILDVLRAATSPMSPQEIADAADLGHETVKKQLNRMVSHNEVIKISRGRYADPERSQVVPFPARTKRS